jgi:hypothetical protein
MKKQKGKIRFYLIVGVLSIALSGISVTAYAWNIICGVSIAFTGPCDGGQALLARQYEVDSKLLKGIGEYNLAISELQLVDIDVVKKKGAGERDIALIRNGESHLKASLENIKSALGDGRKLLAEAARMPCKFSIKERAIANDSLESAGKLAKILESILQSISINVLPRVEIFHEGFLVSQKIIDNGMKLSKGHIGKSGHSGVNEDIKFGPR